MFGKVSRDVNQIRTGLLPNAEALERYPRPSELLIIMPSHVGRNDLRCGVYANPIYLTGYILGAMVRTLPTNTDYRVKTIAPDPTHTIVTAKLSRRVGIACMRPLVYQRLSHTIANRIISRFRSTDGRSPGNRPDVADLLRASLGSPPRFRQDSSHIRFCHCKGSRLA
jgi:hypothetical protein